MPHGTIRAATLPAIIRLISERYCVNDNKALKMFYESHIGACYADDESGLYGQSALYVFSLFCEEIDTSSTNSDMEVASSTPSGVWTSGFNGFPKEFADFLYELEFNNTIEKLPENKPVYKRLITEPLTRLYQGLAPTALSVSDTLITKPSKCVSTMYNDMRFSRATPLKRYMYIRFREPFNEKDVLGLYFDMGCEYYSYGIRIYKQTASGIERIRSFIMDGDANKQVYIRELANMKSMGMSIIGEKFAKDRFPDIENNLLKDFLNSKNFHIGQDFPISDIVFNGALLHDISNAFIRLKGLYTLLKYSLYGI